MLLNVALEESKGSISIQMELALLVHRETQYPCVPWRSNNIPKWFILWKWLPQPEMYEAMRGGSQLYDLQPSE